MSLRADVDDRRELMAVREQVAMAEDDALGRAFGTGREQHDRRIVGARGVVTRTAQDRLHQRAAAARRRRSRRAESSR